MLPTANSQQPTARPIIGLVGQVCAGKSTVADAFQQEGARRFTTRMHRCAEIYTRPETIEAGAAEMFGAGVIDANGQVNRKALAKIVLLADAAKLEALTSRIIFPRTGKAIAEGDRSVSESSDAPLLLLDAPTLFESGREGLCSTELCS